MTVPYSGACSKKEKGLSTGSVLVLLFFIGVSLYLLVGIGYNGFIAHKSGIELIPHFNIWSAILLFALVLFLRNLQQLNKFTQILMLISIWFLRMAYFGPGRLSHVKTLEMINFTTKSNLFCRRLFVFTLLFYS